MNKKPIFKNVHLSEVLSYPTPEGSGITIHPGEYVVGVYFTHLTKRGVFEMVEADLTTVEPQLIKYEQKK